MQSKSTSKSMDWCLHDKDLRHERVKNHVETRSSYIIFLKLYLFLSFLSALILPDGIQKLQERVVECALVS